MQRIALSIEATAREPGRVGVPVRAVDISTNGCRVELFNDGFSGSLVWLTIKGLAAQSSRILWQKDGFAGLEFLTPLADVILDALIANQPRPSSVAVEDLRELAARTRRIALQSLDPWIARAVLDLSRDCSLHAIVCGLKLAETQSSSAPVPQLTSGMIRRNSFERAANAGFSFSV